MDAIVEQLMSTESASDAQLVAQSLVAPTGFAELFQRHGDAVFRFAAMRVGPDHAEDIVGETFAIAFDRRSKFDQSASSARPWLYGIAANRLLKHHEAERRWLERSLLEPNSSAESELSLADERVDASRMAPALAAALLELTSLQRSVLVLFALDELTHEQIAATLDIRVGTAKSHLSRGRARLRTILESEEVHHD